MKKILGGKKYNTETAHRVGEHWNGNTGFGTCSETIYRKRTGEYFLYGEGGPMSKYSVSYGDNEWGYGQEIQPLTVDEAKEWAEEHLDADKYEQEFGEVEE